MQKLLRFFLFEMCLLGLCPAPQGALEAAARVGAGKVIAIASVLLVIRALKQGSH